MRQAIVSVLIGNYDSLKNAPNFSGYDSILFTDQQFADNKGWRVINVPSGECNKTTSRFYKWMTHITLPQYDKICYIDASMILKQIPEHCLWFKHPNRTTVREEINRCIQLGKTDRETALKQWQYYKANGFKDINGLYQNGFFVRMNESKINKVCETVVDIVQEFTHRDQIALPFALYKHGYEFTKLMNGIKSYNYVLIKNHLRIN